METFGGQIQTKTVNVAAPVISVTLTSLQEFVNYSISVRLYINPVLMPSVATLLRSGCYSPGPSGCLNHLDP